MVCPWGHLEWRDAAFLLIQPVEVEHASWGRRGSWLHAVQMGMAWLQTSGENVWQEVFGPQYFCSMEEVRGLNISGIQDVGGCIGQSIYLLDEVHYPQLTSHRKLFRNVDKWRVNGRSHLRKIQ
jgi:hypothetical protein